MEDNLAATERHLQDVFLAIGKTDYNGWTETVDLMASTTSSKARPLLTTFRTASSDLPWTALPNFSSVSPPTLNSVPWFVLVKSHQLQPRSPWKASKTLSYASKNTSASE